MFVISLLVDNLFDFQGIILFVLPISNSVNYFSSLSFISNSLSFKLSILESKVKSNLF